MTEEHFPKEMSQEEFGRLAHSLAQRDMFPREITADVFMLKDETGWAYYTRPSIYGHWKRIQHGGSQ